MNGPVARTAACMLGVLMLSGLFGCSEQQLTGSLATVYPLEFELLRARLYSSTLSLEYVQVDGAVPIRVSINRAAITPGGTVDLLEDGDLTGRTSEGRDIPRFDGGDVRFDVFDVVPGAVASGDFRATFVVTETDTLALRGQFSAEIEGVADPGPPPPTPEDDGT